MAAGKSPADRRRDNAADQVAYAATALSEALTLVQVRSAKLEERLRAACEAGVQRYEAEAMTKDLSPEVAERISRIYAEFLADKFEVTGADTVMWCLAHRRKVTWMPAPGWWIHDDGRPSTGHPGDPRGCSSMWAADAPITVTRKTT